MFFVVVAFNNTMHNVKLGGRGYIGVEQWMLCRKFHIYTKYIVSNTIERNTRHALHNNICLYGTPLFFRLSTYNIRYFCISITSIHIVVVSTTTWKYRTLRGCIEGRPQDVFRLCTYEYKKTESAPISRRVAYRCRWRRSHTSNELCRKCVEKKGKQFE